MFALVFRFPAGRYHATPWGRHVNEGDIAWPPEPYRILRALIAIWHRKADRTRFPEAELDALIHSLSYEAPHFRLPEAVHAHTRHYMPGKLKPVLVLDGFLRLRPEDELVAVWPETTLSTTAFTMAQHLTERITYFGRAESIAEVAVLQEYDINYINCRPNIDNPDQVAIDVLTPLSTEIYAATRERLLRSNDEKPESKKRLRFEACLPETLRKALQVETSDLQEVGWSRPPAAHSVLYHRQEIGPRPSMQSKRVLYRTTRKTELPTIARLVLAGKPRPRIEEAVKIGELFRCALLWKTGHASDQNAAKIPVELLGRNLMTGAPTTSNHDHAFFLPEDADKDGFIDHLLLYARAGLSPETRIALENLHRLWINEHRKTDAPNEDDEDTAKGRREWRLALEGFGDISDFADDCALLRPSKSWMSITPYLRPWHAKTRSLEIETCRMIEKECRLRNLPIEQATLGDDNGTAINLRNVLAFHRFRSRRGLVQPDRSGTALRLTFSETIKGPIALGFGCHYGLGLFRADEE
ncbi:MAG TPA: type I-U CRISPR-associated protein Csb2 [Candidatus Baltobacteraceae bacterium]|nr:type I-U CRISPR-associated protein Csb2 [Candidatus Baltobacteraceae bacterium]